MSNLSFRDRECSIIVRHFLESSHFCDILKEDFESCEVTQPRLYILKKLISLHSRHQDAWGAEPSHFSWRWLAA